MYVRLNVFRWTHSFLSPPLSLKLLPSLLFSTPLLPSLTPSHSSALAHCAISASKSPMTPHLPVSSRPHNADLFRCRPPRAPSRRSHHVQTINWSLLPCNPRLAWFRSCSQLPRILAAIERWELLVVVVRVVESAEGGNELKSWCLSWLNNASWTWWGESTILSEQVHLTVNSYFRKR